MSDSIGKLAAAATMEGAIVFVVGGLTMMLAISFCESSSEPGFLPNASHWDRGLVPLRVAVERHTAEGPTYPDADRRMVGQVIEHANTQLGFALFQLVDAKGDDAPVHIELDVPWEVNAGGEGVAEVRQVMGVAIGCDILLSSTTPLMDEGAGVFHEVGHCLGLAHDDTQSSVMYPVTGDAFAGSRGFTDRDVALLRERYRSVAGE